MRPIAPGILACAALAAVACAGAPQDPGPEELAGCWYFTRDAVADSLNLPWGVRLVDAPLEGWPALHQLEGVRRATTLTPDGDEDHPFGYWRPADADSIAIGYPAGGGLHLTLAPDTGARVLTGAARPVGDAMPMGGQGAQRPVRAVRLERARCPEE